MDRKILEDRCVTQQWTHLFSTHIGDGEDSTLEDGKLLCYTDGSGQGAGTGSGLAVYTDNQAHPVYTNVEYTGKAIFFQAELRAIQMACEFAETQPHTKILILSDSQAAIQASVFPLIRSRTVLQTVDILNKNLLPLAN
jgi:ribonuclease HI